MQAMAQGNSRIPAVVKALGFKSCPPPGDGAVGPPSGKWAPGVCLDSFETSLSLCEVCDQSWKNSP